MITATAAWAARNFAHLLDAVEQGETVVVTRNGILVGRLTAERRTSADQATLEEILNRAGGRSGGSVPLQDAVAAIRDDRDRR